MEIDTSSGYFVSKRIATYAGAVLKEYPLKTHFEVQLGVPKQFYTIVTEHVKNNLPIGKKKDGVLTMELVLNDDNFSGFENSNVSFSIDNTLKDGLQFQLDTEPSETIEQGYCNLHRTKNFLRIFLSRNNLEATMGLLDDLIMGKTVKQLETNRERMRYAINNQFSGAYNSYGIEDHVKISRFNNKGRALKKEMEHHIKKENFERAISVYSDIRQCYTEIYYLSGDVDTKMSALDELVALNKFRRGLSKKKIINFEKN